MTDKITDSQNDLSKLNDDFGDKSSLNKWQTHHQNEYWPSFTEKIEIIEKKNSLYIEPQSSGWYNEFHRGPFLFKEVEGNFTVITKIKVSGKSTDSPTKAYSLAGLMVRKSRANSIDKHAKGEENWLFLSTGSATKKGVAQFESKNTVNGKSKLKVFPSKSSWVYLAISRKGNVFYQSYRFADCKEWTLLRVIERSDMPNLVQVGLLAYTDFWSPARKYFFNRKKFNTKAIKGNPDLIAQFGYIHYHRTNNKAINYEEGFHLSPISEENQKILGLK